MRLTKREQNLLKNFRRSYPEQAQVSDGEIILWLRLRFSEKKRYDKIANSGLEG